MKSQSKTTEESIYLAEFKRKECIGDALWNFLTRHYLWTSTHDDGFKKRIMFHAQQNDVMCKIGEAIGIKAVNPNCPLSDALEVKIYEEFLIGGFDQANKWFVDIVMPQIDKLK